MLAIMASMVCIFASRRSTVCLWASVWEAVRRSTFREDLEELIGVGLQGGVVGVAPLTGRHQAAPELIALGLRHAELLLSLA